MPRLLLVALWLVAAIACAAPAGATPTPEVTPAPARASEAAQSVICDAFAAGGGADLTAEAATAAIEGENPAVPTRDAMEAYREVAESATGDEKEDLLTVADAMNSAAMTDEGDTGWSPASEASYVKYAEQCGEEPPSRQ